MKTMMTRQRHDVRLLDNRHKTSSSLKSLWYHSTPTPSLLLRFLPFSTLYFFFFVFIAMLHTSSSLICFTSRVRFSSKTLFLLIANITFIARFVAPFSLSPKTPQWNAIKTHNLFWLLNPLEPSFPWHTHPRTHKHTRARNEFFLIPGHRGLPLGRSAGRLSGRIETPKSLKAQIFTQTETFFLLPAFFCTIISSHLSVSLPSIALCLACHSMLMYELSHTRCLTAELGALLERAHNFEKTRAVTFASPSSSSFSSRSHS